MKVSSVKNNERPKVANTKQGRRNVSNFEGPVKKEPHFTLFSDWAKFRGAKWPIGPWVPTPLQTQTNTHTVQTPGFWYMYRVMM